MPDRPGSTRCHYGSTRCHYGPSRSQHGRYTDRPGLPRTKDSSRTVTDDPGNFKHFKTSVVVSRTMPDHAGPSRTITDHPGLSRITTDPTRIWPRIGKNSVRDGPGQSGTLVWLSFNMWNLNQMSTLNKMIPLAEVLVGGCMGGGLSEPVDYYTLMRFVHTFTITIIINFIINSPWRPFSPHGPPCHCHRKNLSQNFMRAFIHPYHRSPFRYLDYTIDIRLWHIGCIQKHLLLSLLLK